jgi:two-component system KDP operon response regulator KdpE
LPRILHIDNDGTGGDHLADSLSGDEFSVERVAHLSDLGRALEDLEPDLVVVSCTRPDEQALAFCSGLRQISAIPIVVCSPSARESDIVRVFEAGADDYLVAPIRPVELNARLRAVLRRTAEAPVKSGHGETLAAGDVELRLKEHKAYRRGHPLDLSPMEFRLLTVLVQETGRAVSHSRLIANVWGPEYVDCRHYLRLYVKYLRSKLEDDPKNPRLILSEWGVGYRFEPAVAQT